MLGVFLDRPLSVSLPLLLTVLRFFADTSISLRFHLVCLFEGAHTGLFENFKRVTAIEAG